MDKTENKTENNNETQQQEQEETFVPETRQHPYLMKVKTNKKKVHSSSLTLQNIDSIVKQKIICKYGRFFSIVNLSVKAMCCLNDIHSWFTNDILKTIVIPLTSEKHNVSLRALDWLCTSYSEKENIVIPYDDPFKSDFNIKQNHDMMLNKYKRKLFDPFRRNQRIYYWWKDLSIPDSPTVLQETTIAQLNFIHWVVVHGVFDYALTHLPEIEHDYYECQKRNKLKKKQAQLMNHNYKRNKLSNNKKINCSIYSSTKQRPMYI